MRHKATVHDDMPTRALGKTGERVSVLGLGGSHIGQPNVTRREAAGGEYELFKTTSHFDSTVQHPEWLGGESARVKELAGN